MLCHQFGMGKNLFLSISLPSSCCLSPLHYCSFPGCCFLMRHLSLYYSANLPFFASSRHFGLCHSLSFLSLHFPSLLLVSLRTDCLKKMSVKILKTTYKYTNCLELVFKYLCNTVCWPNKHFTFPG